MRKIFSLMLAVMMLVLVGCGSSKVVDQGERSDLEQELKSVLENSRSMESGTVEIKLDGNVNISEGEESNVALFDASLDINYGLADEITRLRDFMVNLLVNYDLNNNPDSFQAELVMKDKTLFAKLVTMPAPLAMFGASEFEGQWLSFEIPEEFLDNPVWDSLVKDSNLVEETEEEKALKEMYYETNFFKEIKDHGNVRFNGQSHRKYEVSFDNDAILDYYVESARILEEEVSAEDLENVRMILENMTLRMEFLISEDDLLSQVSGSVLLEFAEDGDEVELELNFEVTMLELSDGLEVVAPEGAMDIMNALMGPALMM